MLYRGRRYTTVCFVSVLRQIFKNHPQFAYLKDFLKSKIYIDESYPRGERKFPCIICTDVTDGQYFESSFDRNFQEDIYDNQNNYTGTVYGMTIQPTIQLTISALSKYDAEIIADFVCSYMQFYGVNKFADAGITILNASGSTPQIEEYGKNNIYTITLTYNLQCEWQKFLPVNDDIVDSVVIPDIEIIYPDENGKETTQHEGESVIIKEDKP